MKLSCDHPSTVAVVFLCIVFMSCTKESGSNPALVGAWKSRVEFQSGSLGSIKDLEFMYAFNAGGTMTESSNYDAAPPVPPAYGVWSPMGSNLYEARYEFYVTRQPTPDEAAAASSGWLPAGYGVLNEIITLSEDGTSFTSAIRYELFDQGDKPVAGGGSGTGHGVRLRLK